MAGFLSKNALDIRNIYKFVKQITVNLFGVKVLKRKIYALEHQSHSAKSKIEFILQIFFK